MRTGEVVFSNCVETSFFMFCNNEKHLIDFTFREFWFNEMFFFLFKRRIQEITFLFRVLFGPNHLFVFHHPQDEAKQAKKGIKSEAPTYDSAQEEIAKKAGLMGLEQGEGTSRGIYI